MPRNYPVVLPMSIDEFHHMEPWLGWKHEYWDGAARLSVQETAVVSFQRTIGPLTDSPPLLCAGEQLRLVRPDDSDSLVKLFMSAFDDAIDYAGYPDDAYRREAEDNIASFFGNPTSGRRQRSNGGRLGASFTVVSSKQLVAAVLVRSIRRGPILEPIMVHPEHQRRGLGHSLLSATFQALQASGESALFSRCHLGNAASLAWHAKHGFEEIPDYFSATHRWRHFSRLADHCNHVGQSDRAEEMQTIADHWQAVVNRLEASGDRWPSGLVD